MAKNQVCIKKTCWSTKNTVIEEAGKIEESHVGEELVTRIKPHSHKKDNPIDKNNDINNNENMNKKNKIIYYFNKTYLKNITLQDTKISEYGMQVSYVKDTPKGKGEGSYSIIGKDNKKVDGFVKLTLSKIIKLGEYVMTLTTPQWNKVSGSPEDLDAYAITLSQKDTVSEENAKYEIGYNFLKYRA